jgi:hypothetical protein
MVFVNDLIARLGPRLFAAIGAVMMGLSLFLIARVQSVSDLFVAYLAMAPAFAMLTNAAVANIVGLWFTSKRGLALSVALTGGAVGGLAIVPTLVWLNSRLCFAIALEVIAAVTIPILLVTIALCIRLPTSDEVETGGIGGKGTKSHTMTRRQALASAHYWTIAGPLTLAIMVQVGFIVHQVSFLFPVLGQKGAGLAVFLTALMAATSRIVVGFFIDRLDQRIVGALLLAASLCAFCNAACGFSGIGRVRFRCRGDDHAADTHHPARVPTGRVRAHAGDHSDRKQLRPVACGMVARRNRQLRRADHRLHGDRDPGDRNNLASYRSSESRRTTAGNGAAVTRLLSGHCNPTCQSGVDQSIGKTLWPTVLRLEPTELEQWLAAAQDSGKPIPEEVRGAAAVRLTRCAAKWPARGSRGRVCQGSGNRSGPSPCRSRRA